MLIVVEKGVKLRHETVEFVLVAPHFMPYKFGEQGVAKGVRLGLLAALPGTVGLLTLGPGFLRGLKALLEGFVADSWHVMDSVKRMERVGVV